MRWTPQDIKQAIANELQKTGHSIDDLEVILANKPETVEKMAEELQKIGAFDPASLVNAGKGVASLLGGLSLGVGALGGTALYAGYRANQDSNDRIMKKMKEQQQYNQATEDLKAAMMENQARI